MSEGVINKLKLQGFEPALVDELMLIGRKRSVKKDAVVIAKDDVLGEIPFVIEGLLKLMRSDGGNELFLYYLNSGETCAMSINCCLEGTRKPISVIAEEDSLLWMVPASAIDSLVRKYQGFRRFVFRTYQERFDEMLAALDSIAFLKMDERVIKYLLDKKQALGSFEIHMTHQEIARDLNTSRVVVSRLLKQLEKEGRIEQHRNRIEIL